MKKLSLLLVAGAIAMTASAQERQGGVLNIQNTPVHEDKSDAAPIWRSLNEKNHHQAAAKGTSGGGRWYNYGGALDTSEMYQNVVVNGFAYYPQFVGEETIWPDTNGTALYSGGVYQHVTDVCEAAVFDPTAALFNTDKDQAYEGLIWVGPTNAYTWDSVNILGKYFYNRTKTTEVDTLRLVFLTGSGGGSSDDIFSGYSMAGGHYNAKTFFEMSWDSLHNTACTHSFTRPDSMDIYLTSADWIDTSAQGFWSKSVPTRAATGIPVPAGGFCGMSLTFISGDNTARGVGGPLHTPTPGDTLLNSYPNDLGGGNRYNLWRPIVSYYQTSGGTAAWAPYQCPAYEPTSSDNNLGYWKALPNSPADWDDVFSPTWAWSSGGGAATLQYPTIDFHIVCPTCALITTTLLDAKTVATVNSVKAYPNPTTGDLNVVYELSQASDVTVSLTNMLGQVVATQKVNNKAAGSVVFNTANLADGAYIYTLSANGTVTTGRVAVAH